MNNWLRYWVVPASFALALVLTMLPLPAWAQPYRPDWVALVALYWVLALPRVFGIGLSWFCGLLVDVVQGALLGQHALGMAVIAYFAYRFHQRIRVYPLAQQGLLVLLLLCVKLTIVLWINGITGHAPDNLLLYYAPALIGMLLWPWIFTLLRDVRRRQKLR